MLRSFSLAALLDISPGRCDYARHRLFGSMRLECINIRDNCVNIQHCINIKSLIVFIQNRRDTELYLPYHHLGD